MKNCPHCNAAIRENAKFCINCMTPLEKKPKTKVHPFAINKKFFLTITVTALISVLSTVSVFMFLKGGNTAITTPQGQDSADTTSQETSATDKNDTLSDDLITTPQTNSSGDASGSPPLTPSAATGSSSSESQNDNSSTTEQNSQETPPKNDKEEPPEVQTPTEENTEEEQEEEQYVTYHYVFASSYPDVFKNARTGKDLFTEEYLKDKIMISGAEGITPDGVYKIPETIDGYTVIAIAAEIFYQWSPSYQVSPISVKRIIIPKTVEYIGDNSFSACKNLDDVYYYGKSLYTSQYTYYSDSNHSVKFHCFKDCVNTYNDMLYLEQTGHKWTDVEWDGVLPN